MATKLTYSKLPQVKNGMWSIRQKIYYGTGYVASIYQNANNLVLNFSEDLTAQEEDDVSAIINDTNAQGPDVDLMVTNNTLIIPDLYDYRDEIATETGIDFSIWYRSTGTFPGRNDEIVIIPTDSTHTAQRILTNPQKNNLAAAFDEAGSGKRWE